MIHPEDLPEGVHDELSQMIYEDLGLCGCGMPGEVANLYVAIMRQMKARSDFYDANPGFGINAPHYPWAGEWPELKDLPEAVQWALLYALSNADFTDHGGNCMGSWLTDKGKRFLELYDAGHVTAFLES